MVASDGKLLQNAKEQDSDVTHVLQWKLGGLWHRQGKNGYL